MVKLQEKTDHQNNLQLIGQMAATIAHEIRNPMTSINGFIELLKMNSTEENKKYLSIMKSELDRMEQILSEILHLSKPVERKYELISVANIANEIKEIMTPLADFHKIKIVLNIKNHSHSNILGNSTRIKQMLMNLVKNAIEEMDMGGTITITLKNVKNKVQITICDEGRGIAKEDIPNLFQPFYTTKAEGTGLGLQIVKSVVEEHEGNIYVKSIENVGTSFVIELPLTSESYQPSYKILIK
ncbi:sensor histidine kinase [Ureibacillus acetophenoni]|uniref:histidine kinase n=1 Tax=Ureibacillus acetophenoni TaxID=614649 RepID=A0A285U4F1_9BACL|nr:HAMP domain-containing sensor histidine kinase [Ureibacillus acetophenoni]SOC35151.1 phospho-acceptor domain-containing protein [Ureibacillus acetophenoni]